MEEKVTVKQVGVRYGIIAAIVFIIYGLILQISGLVGNQSLGYVNYLILAIIVFLAHKTFKEKGDGAMRFGQGLSIGMIITAIGTVVSMIFSYVYIKFIDDSMITLIRDKAYSSMEEQGMPDEQIEQAMSMSEKFMTPEMIIVFGTIFFLFFGFIICLVLSAITQKAKSNIVA